MNRAAILPHPADPFMLAYWLKYFKIWESEIDKLYIYVNSPIEKPVIDFMHRLCDQNPKINWQYNNVQVEHGYAIDRCLDIVQESYVMLIEDDGFIFKPGMVDRQFQDLENGVFDVIGSPRGSCSTEIWDRAKEIWGLDYSGLGDVGPNFWPCYFFTKKDILLKTNRNFASKAWKRDEIIAPLGNYVVKDPICTSDTFVEASLQIRALIPKDRIKIIPQYHGSPEDLEHYDRMYNLFDGRSPWVHVGSLSSGTHGVLMDDQGRSLAYRLIKPPKEKTVLPGQCNSEQERNEWERRVQWWLTFWEYVIETMTIPADMLEFITLYRLAIDRIIQQYALSTSRIKRRQRIYKTLGL